MQILGMVFLEVLTHQSSWRMLFSDKKETMPVKSRDKHFAIVTPAHNEARFLPRVIDSILSQESRPSMWLIMDDRSSDDTWAIIQAAAQKHAFIKGLKCDGAGESVLGSHVARLFTKGMAAVPRDMDFFIKMDADIILPPNYFAELLARFNSDPQMGIASGKIYIEHEGQWLQERFPDFHVPGACKMYRAACYRHIGGVIPVYGWDIMDGVKARMLGWQTRSYPDLKIQHLRMMGSRKGMLQGHLGHGRGMYAVRAHPLFVLARALYRAIEPPYLSGLLILAGYFQGWLKNEPRLQDRKLAAYLRKEQLSRLLGKHLSKENLLPDRIKK